MRITILALAFTVTTACSVGDRYVIASDTLAAIQTLTPEARKKTVAPAIRQKGGWNVDVRTDAFSLHEAATRSDGQVAIPTRMFSKKIQLGNVLVWIGTPLSIAGLCMVIFGHDAVRWSGIALAGAAEPVMIAGTVLWVKGSNAHPQEVGRGVPELNYLPTPGSPVSGRSP